MDQVGQSNQGKTGPNSKNPTTPFEQLLAMLQSIGGLAQPDGATSTEGPANNQTKSASVKTEPAQDSTNADNVSIEDWTKLHNILADWLVGLQQVQSMINNQPANNTTQVTVQNQINVVNSKGIQNIEQLLQTTTQKGETSSALASDLLDRMATLLDSSFQKSISQMIGHITNMQKEIQDKVNHALDFSQVVTTEQPSGPKTSPSQTTGRVSAMQKEIPDKMDHVFHFSTEQSPVEQSSSSKPSSVPILDKNLVSSAATKTVMDKSSVPVGTRAVTSPVTNKDPFLLNQNLMISPLQDTPILDKSLPVLPTVVPVSQFTPEVSEWVNHQIRFSNDMQGTTEAKISLNPEHLGQVDIKIVSNQGQLSAEIVTNTLMGKEAIEGQLQQLKDALQEHGFEVQKLDVTYEVPQTNDSQSAGFQFTGGGSNSFQEQSSSSSRRKAGNSKNAAIEGIEMEDAINPYGAQGRTGTSQIDFTA